MTDMPTPAQMAREKYTEHSAQHAYYMEGVEAERKRAREDMRDLEHALEDALNTVRAMRGEEQGND